MKKLITIVVLLLVSLAFAAPRIISGNTIENEDLRIDISVRHEFLNGYVLYLTVINKTSEPIKIIWDESIFTDNSGNDEHLVRSTIRAMNIGKSTPPSVIVPNGTFTDWFVPETHLNYYGTLGWVVTSISNEPNERNLLITYELENQKKYIYGKVVFEPPSSTDEILMWVAIGALAVGLTVGLLVMLMM